MEICFCFLVNVYIYILNFGIILALFLVIRYEFD